MINLKFKKKLVKLRKDQGWSQTALGERVGVKIAHLSRLENGIHPSVEMLLRISKAFGVSMDYSMEEEADEISPVSIKDKPLVERIGLMSQLEDTDRQTIINVIDSMLTQKNARPSHARPNRGIVKEKVQ